MQQDKKNLKALGAARVDYKDQYDPSQLELIERAPRRAEYKVQMNGVDIWTAFEVSFLNKRGLPQYMVLRIANNAHSKYIFESKSLKLYLNSFNNTVFESKDQVIGIVSDDLSKVAGKLVYVEEYTGEKDVDLYVEAMCLEALFPETIVEDYHYNKNLLRTEDSVSNDIYTDIYSDLLRSNCEITNQPDWGRVFVEYKGPKKLNPESFLKYLVSYRNHQEFHEPTCERIFNDLVELMPENEITVICQYTRRGGIDINPIRTTKDYIDLNFAIKLPKLIQQ